MRDMTRNRTRNQRAARWAEFWTIMAVCGFLTLVFMLACASPSQWCRRHGEEKKRGRLTVGTGQPPGEKPKA